LILLDQTLRAASSINIREYLERRIRRHRLPTVRNCDSQIAPQPWPAIVEPIRKSAAHLVLIIPTLALPKECRSTIVELTYRRSAVGN
jgi:hypothetical protein